MKKLVLVLFVAVIICSISKAASAEDILVDPYFPPDQVEDVIQICNNVQVLSISCKKIYSICELNKVEGTATIVTFGNKQEGSGLPCIAAMAVVLDGKFVRASYSLNGKIINEVISEENNEGLLQLVHTAFVTQKPVEVQIMPQKLILSDGTTPPNFLFANENLALANKDFMLPQILNIEFINGSGVIGPLPQPVPFPGIIYPTDPVMVDTIAPVSSIDNAAPITTTGHAGNNAAKTNNVKSGLVIISAGAQNNAQDTGSTVEGKKSDRGVIKGKILGK